ncbi:MAG: hypothetical protein NTY48_07380 [Candidatus Diapherotrites archaeon]|nr:hypothetical protein [Candidatus Diapherotrites archaeon]
MDDIFTVKKSTIHELPADVKNEIGRKRELFRDLYPIASFSSPLRRMSTFFWKNGADFLEEIYLQSPEIFSDDVLLLNEGKKRIKALAEIFPKIVKASERWNYTQGGILAEELLEYLYSKLGVRTSFKDKIQGIKESIRRINEWTSFFEKVPLRKGFSLKPEFVTEMTQKGGLGHAEAALWVTLQKEGKPLATAGVSFIKGGKKPELIIRNLQGAVVKKHSPDKAKILEQFSTSSGENFRVFLGKLIHQYALEHGVHVLHGGQPFGGFAGVDTQLARQYRQSYRKIGFPEKRVGEGEYQYRMKLRGKNRLR